MANKAKVKKIEEELCEGCDSPTTPVVEEEKSMKSMPKGKRAQVQDEYNADEDEMEEEGCGTMKEEADEDEEEMEEGSYMKKESKSVKENKKMTEEEECEDEDEDEDEDEEDMEESFDVNSLFTGQDLSEDFKLKVTTLFEAAVNSRAKKLEEQLATKFTELLESEVEQIANDLTEKVDSYLNYVVSEWMEENKLAVERGIRTDVAESFINGLRTLFNEHNISVPEGQTDLLDETANNLEKITEQLNLQTKKTVELSEQLKKYQRAEIFAEVAEGLSSAQTEKLRGLAEGMSFSDNSEFKAKLQILKENYSKTSKPAVSSVQVEDAAEPTVLNEDSRPDIKAYLEAMLRRTK